MDISQNARRGLIIKYCCHYYVVELFLQLLPNFGVILYQISSAIEEALVVYARLNSWQKNDARIDIPKALHHLLSTVHFSSDTAVLSVCMRFICLIFEDHSDMLSFCADIILLKILVRCNTCCVVMSVCFDHFFAHF